MALDPAGAIALCKRELFQPFAKQRERAFFLDNWVKARPPKPIMPPSATGEYKELQDRSHTPWLALVVNSVAQALYAEGIQNSDEDGPELPGPAWERWWQPNGLDNRQGAVYRGALVHGLSFATVLPGVDPLTRTPRAQIRGKSAKRLAAFYEDEGEDEFPYVALDGKKETAYAEDGTATTVWRLGIWDDTYRHEVTCDEDGFGGYVYQRRQTHNAGVVPVVRFANTVDLDGEVMGEVEPFIPLVSRIDQDTFDRLVVQRFGAWKVRWIAGMAKPQTDAEKRAAAIALRQEDLLVSGNPDTKFGTFEATSMTGYIQARTADIQDLAAVSQTPPHHLLGLSPNLSAEALAAAESSLMRKVEERRHSFGESWESTLRLAAHIDGDPTLAMDFASQIRWRDIESRSLAQVADALGKIATQLKVPFEMLWDRIPGWTDQDTKRAKALLEEAGADAVIAALVEQLGGGGPADSPTSPTTNGAAGGNKAAVGG